MSVEKVNRYKEQKANRREILAKEKAAAKRLKMATTAVIAAVILLVAGAIGLTIRNQIRIYQKTRPNYDTTTMLVADLAGVLEEEAEETDAQPQ